MAYAKVEETFWHDKVVRSLSEDGRTFFFYLITCPHKNRLGCFVLDPMYAAADLQWDPARVAEGIAELQRRERIDWDAEHRVVFVRNHAEHNTLENPQVVKGAISDLRALPDTHLLTPARDALELWKRAHYGPLFAAFAERFAKQLPQRLEPPTPPTPPQPLPKPTPRQPVTATATATVTDPVTEASPPEASSQGRQTGSRARDRSVDDEIDPFTTFVDDFPDALGVLKRLKHKGGKESTLSSIRSRILFTRDDLLAAAELKGTPLPERVRLFAAALIEYADQGGREWNTRAVVGYMGRLIRTRGEQEREERERLAKANEGREAQREAQKAALEATMRRLEAEAVQMGVSPDLDASAIQRTLSEKFNLRALGGSSA